MAIVLASKRAIEVSVSLSPLQVTFQDQVTYTAICFVVSSDVQPKGRNHDPIGSA